MTTQREEEQHRAVQAVHVTCTVSPGGVNIVCAVYCHLDALQAAAEATDGESGEVRSMRRSCKGACGVAAAQACWMGERLQYKAEVGLVCAMQGRDADAPHPVYSVCASNSGRLRSRARSHRRGTRDLRKREGML